MPSRYDGEIVFSLVDRGPQDVIAASDHRMYEWTSGAWAATTYQLYRGSPSWEITTHGSQLWGLASPATGDLVVRLQGSAWVPVGKPEGSTTYQPTPTATSGRSAHTTISRAPAP